MKSIHSPQPNRSRLTIKFIVAATSTAMIAGCTTDPRTGQPSFKETFASDDPCSNNARNIGVAVGAIAGAILGNQAKHSNGARLLGATAGAALGGLIGHDMDQRRCALAKIAKQYDLNLKTSTVSANGTVIDDSQLKRNPNAAAIQQHSVGMVVAISDQPDKGGHFESNSDQLTEPAQRYFSAIADSYNLRVAANNIADPAARADYIAQISKRKILLIGHTDDTGNSRLNADLSERRARTVASYMEKRGVPRDSLHYQGAGEAYPIADNASEMGRAQNRRVEIVEVADAASFDRFLAERKPRYDLYRTVESASVPRPAASTPAPAQAATSALPRAGTSRPATPVLSSSGAKPAVRNPAPAALAAQPTAVDTGIDFGGTPLRNAIALADIGTVENRRHSVFQLISDAYADEPPVIGDCTRDRPRLSNGVKTLADGKSYRSSEFLPGLYGKTWTEQVNGHQVVLNKVAVLANDGVAANRPELKVYANYNPARNANPTPSLQATPEVNTYLGNKGLLYRMFLNGKAGLNCVDVVFASEGGATAKSGRLVYTHAAQVLAADFKPKIYQK